MTICIGRQYGSGGREVGQLLAKKLGIPCYDKLLVSQAAKEAGMSEKQVSETEERADASAWMLSGNPFADSAAIAHTFYTPSQRIFDAERDTICRLAEQGDCVIVGRCASDILGRDNCYSVFIYAAEENRLARVQKRNDLTPKLAAQRLRRVDRLRRQYFDFYAGTRWGHRESYDLMLDSDTNGVEGCAEIILAGLKQWEARHE